MLSAEMESRRLAQIERHLNQLGSMVKGNQDFQADRVADVMEQIEELRQQLAAVREWQKRAGEFLNQLRKNGHIP